MVCLLIRNIVQIKQQLVLKYMTSIKKSYIKRHFATTVTSSSGMFSIGDVCYYCNGFKTVKCLSCDGKGKCIDIGMKEYICKGCYGKGENICVMCTGTGNNFLL